MTTGHRSVGIIRLPEVLNSHEERSFLRELEEHLKHNRPRIVVDCSRVQKFDKCVVRLLLHTLEHALRRKGDVRLADVSPEGEALLEATGASRLFQVFETKEGAAESFHHIPALAMLGYSADRFSPTAAENVA